MQNLMHFGCIFKIQDIPEKNTSRLFTAAADERFAMKRRKTCSLLTAMLLILSAVLTAFHAYTPVYAQEAEDEEEQEENDRTLAPYFIIRNEDTPLDCFPLKSTDVKTTINGVIAETYVTQTYANEGPDPISATYVFPVSTAVTVHGMTMEIGNQRVTAKIKEKEEARQEYEEAKSEGKSAALLEQERPNVFTMNVANIMPGDNVSIELHYTELITPVEGIYEFVFPTVVGPRYSPLEQEDGADAGESDKAADVSGGDSSSDTEDSDKTDADGSSDAEDSDKTDADGSSDAEDSDKTDADGSSDADKDSSAGMDTVSGGDSSSGSDDSAQTDGDSASVTIGTVSGGDSSSGTVRSSSHGLAGSRGRDEWIAIPYLPDGETPPGEYNITVELSTGVPITQISCKSHDISVARENDSTAHITLADPEDYAGNRDFILKYKLTGDEIQSGLVCTDGGKGENFFMLTIQPPERYTLNDIPPREYIFVLDVSGSMFGYPLDTAKTLIKNLVSDLRTTDTFNLLLFSGDSVQMAPRSLPATEENIENAISLIEQQEGSGGTELAPALRHALDIPTDGETARSIVVITDGYISNEMEIFDVINSNMDTASFFSFGIGRAVNDYLVEGIAKAGSGEAFVVTDSEDAEESAENFRTYIQSPLLTDIAISYEGFDVYDVEPAVPSTLFAQMPIVLFGKWEGDPDGIIRITGKTGSEEYVQEIPVSDIAVSRDSNAIRYLWANSRLDRITGYGTIRNDSSVKEEITQLGLEYSMATQYTSFVCVLETIRNPGGKHTLVRQASPLPLEVSNFAIGALSLPEPGDAFLLVIPIILFIPALLKKLKGAGNRRKYKS